MNQQSKRTGTIVLRKQGDKWVKDMSMVSDAAEVYALLGTTLDPTPYLAVSRADVVQLWVQALNPCCTVIVGRRIRRERKA